MTDHPAELTDVERVRLRADALAWGPDPDGLSEERLAAGTITLLDALDAAEIEWRGWAEEANALRADLMAAERERDMALDMHRVQFERANRIATENQRIREGIEALAPVLGKHAPIYDFQAGHHLHVCGCQEWQIGGVDRAEAERRFGEHMAEAVQRALLSTSSVRGEDDPDAEDILTMLSVTHRALRSGGEDRCQHRVSVGQFCSACDLFDHNPTPSDREEQR